MIDNKFKILLILAQITVGALLTIIYKTQNSIYVYEGPFYKQNFHPYIQTLTMFIGELLCLPIFLILKHRFPSTFKQRELQAIKNGKKLGMNKLYLIVPAMCDLITSTLHFIALNYVSASGYQMVNGGNIVTCFLFSIFFLKQPLLKSQLFGSIFALLGIAIVSVANIAFSDSGSQQTSSSVGMQIIGYLLLIISLFTSGFFFSFQQKLMSIYHLEPLQIVGYQGIFGVTTYLIITMVLSLIPCNFGIEACVVTPQGFSFMQNWTSYFQQIFSNWLLLFLTFCWIFNVTAYNPLGVNITKYINALARAISDVCQTVFVWAFGIIITLTVGNTYPNFKWEKMDANVIILQLIGFIFLVFGNLIYNQLILGNILNPKKLKQNEAEDDGSGGLLTSQEASIKQS